MLLAIKDTLHQWLRPTLVAIFGRNIPWAYRWRLFFLLQPTLLITYPIASFKYLFRSPFTVQFLEIRPKQWMRALVFREPGVGQGRKLRPLHVDIHSGAFIGGLPEGGAVLCERIAKETGAVVVSITHRCAPEHPFPAAIDDVDATIRWLLDNAEERWGADPTLMTISGMSAGGNLAVAATQQKCVQAPSPTSLKASVTFYAAIDLRLRPDDKPKGLGMPENDPAKILLPLFDAYAAPVRAKNMENPRLNPVLAARETLPERMLLVVPGADILVAEQRAFRDRINSEDERAGETPRVELMYEEEAFHGYLEVPDFVLKDGLKERAYRRAIVVLQETYAKYDWTWAWAK